MICSASWRNRLWIRCDSASAVCFIGPQRPSWIIENERSTQQRDRGAGPTLVSATSKSSTSSRMPRSSPSSRRTRPRPAQHGVLDRPDRVERALVAELPRQVTRRSARRRRRDRGSTCAPRPSASSCWKIRAQRRLAQPPQRLGGQRHPVGVGPEVALSLQLALELAQRLEVARPTARQLPLQRVDVDVVQRRAAGSPGRAGSPAPPGRRGRPPRRRRRPCRATRCRRCRPAAGRGTSRAAAPRRLSASWVISISRPMSCMACCMRPASSSRCSRDSERIIRSAAA